MKERKTITYYTEYDSAVLRDAANSLTNQLVSYVKERRDVGEFETSELNPSELELWRQVNLSLENTGNGLKRVRLFIEFGNGTSDVPLFVGNEGKFRKWIGSLGGSQIIYDELTDIFFRWVHNTGH